MLLLLPTLKKDALCVKPLHPHAMHLSREVPVSCMPCRRDLAPRAKIALKHCSLYVKGAEYDALVDVVDFGSTSSKGATRRTPLWSFLCSRPY